MALRELALIVAAGAGCKQRGRAEPAAGETVPHAAGPIVVDGEWSESDWPKRALRHPLLGDDGALARPYSEVRFLCDAQTLFVALYAADEDIRSTDAFELELGGKAMTIDATGHVTPAMPGARAAVDRDGSLDDAHDDDEEWVIELALPLPHGPQLPARVTRCDTPKDGIQRCGRWHGVLAID